MQGEDIACKFIESHGGRIIERNFRFKGGEIDVIYKDGDYIVFGEIKYRSSSTFGMAEEAVGYRKQRTISRGCDFYLVKNHLDEFTKVRFDVIALNIDEGQNTVKVHYVKNAFDYIPIKKRR
jgi:putative endonuclease